MMLIRITQIMHQPVLSTFLVSWMLLVMESDTQAIFSGCSGDMIFVMDASSSIWVVDFRRQLEFVANLVDTFNIGPGPRQVSIGAITFSDHAHLDFPLNRFQSSAELKKAILKIPYRTGGTNTAEALKLLKTVGIPYVRLKRRPLIAVVITDGLSWDSAQTKREADALHRLDINTHAIGVGDYYGMEELKAIASDPVHGVHRVTSYSALNNIADKFRGRLCEVKIEPTTKPTTTSTEPSTTNPPKVTMWGNRKQEEGSAESTPISRTSERRTRTFPTTEATTLRRVKEINKPQTTMASDPAESLPSGVGSGPQENIATNPSTTISSTITVTTTRKQKTENIPAARTPELLNRNSATADATNPSTTISSTVTMTTTRKQKTENIPVARTPEILNRNSAEADAGTLGTDKETLKYTSQATTEATTSKSVLGENLTGLPENVPANPSATISSTVTMTTTRKQKTENIPGARTPELLNRNSAEADAGTLGTDKETLKYTSQATTEATTSKSVLGENLTGLPGNVPVGNVTEIPQKDYASTVVFGFDLATMGPSRTRSILQFIKYLLPHIGYGKFALVSNALCSSDYNIPLQPAINEDLSKLLPRLNEKKKQVLVDIIRQMNKELFKEANLKNDKNRKRQIGVLFVDPSVSTITSEVLLEAGEMKKKGFELFVIAIGSAVWTDHEMFTELSSQPHTKFIISVPTYKNLLPLVKRFLLHIRETNTKHDK